jgi:hypothetical protein
LRPIHRALRSIDTALRSTDRALRSTDRALRSINPALRSIHRALRSIHPALRSIHPALRSIHRALRSIDRALRLTTRALRAANRPLRSANRAAVTLADILIAMARPERLGIGLAAATAAAAATPARADTECHTVAVDFVPAAGLQIVAWIEDANGNYVDTAFITAATGIHGLGNRVGELELNSGVRWPYGARITTFPVWAHHNGATFPMVVPQESPSCARSATACFAAACSASWSRRATTRSGRRSRS